MLALRVENNLYRFTYHSFEFAESIKKHEIQHFYETLCAVKISTLKKVRHSNYLNPCIFITCESTAEFDIDKIKSQFEPHQLHLL